MKSTILMVGDEGIEPPRLECKSSRLPLHQSPL